MTFKNDAERAAWIAFASAVACGMATVGYQEATGRAEVVGRYADAMLAELRKREAPNE